MTRTGSSHVGLVHPTTRQCSVTSSHRVGGCSGINIQSSPFNGSSTPRTVFLSFTDSPHTHSSAKRSGARASWPHAAVHTVHRRSDTPPVRYVSPQPPTPHAGWFRHRLRPGRIVWKGA